MFSPKNSNKNSKSKEKGRGQKQRDCQNTPPTTEFLVIPWTGDKTQEGKWKEQWEQQVCTGGGKAASSQLIESNSLNPGFTRQTPDLKPVTGPGLNTI